MGKVSEVEIAGHRYRYEYVEGKTVYRGPVGDGPALSEDEFALRWTGTTTKDPQDILSDVFSDLELMNKKLKDGDFEAAKRINEHINENIQLVLDIESFRNMSEDSRYLFNEMKIEEEEDRLISKEDAVNKYAELSVEGLVIIGPGHDPRVRRVKMSPKGEEVSDRIFY